MGEYWEQPSNFIRMADGDVAFVGDTIYNYYDRKVGRILNIGSDGWADTTAGLLNGERMCSLWFAKGKGWVE